MRSIVGVIVFALVARCQTQETSEHANLSDKLADRVLQGTDLDSMKDSSPDLDYATLDGMKNSSPDLDCATLFKPGGRLASESSTRVLRAPVGRPSTPVASACKPQVSIPTAPAFRQALLSKGPGMAPGLHLPSLPAPGHVPSASVKTGSSSNSPSSSVIKGPSGRKYRVPFVTGPSGFVYGAPAQEQSYQELPYEESAALLDLIHPSGQ